MEETVMIGPRRIRLTVLAGVLPARPAAAAVPEGQATWAVHITLAPTWFDPAETSGIITPFMVLYAMHDALVKPMPGKPMAPSLAESWTQSKDGLVYEFVLRKYVEQVGEDGFKKAPVGAGPYKFVSFKPGVELVLEAHEQYWRKIPTLKTLVFRTIPDESTRLAALKRGEVDVAYSITGPLAEEAKRSPGLALVPTYFTFTTWLVFTDQWDPKSPWHDRRVRLAANLAIDRAGINQAVYLGLSKLAHSFIPQGMEYFWAPPAYAFDPRGAKRLLAEAGYPNGFESGDLSGDTIYGVAIGEPVANY